MRRHSWSGAAIIVALSFVAIACGEKGSSAPSVTSPITPTTPGSSPLSLARTADTLTVDESLQLSAIIPPLPGSSTSATTWTSSDPNVAIVTQNGVLFALKSGRTTVTVTNRGASASTTVTVRPTIREVKFDSDTTAIGLTESVKLQYKVIDSDGGNVDLTGHKVEWSSDSPDIAPLTGSATITGRAIGLSQVMLAVDGHGGSTHVKVVPKPVARISVAPASVAIVAGQNVQLVTTTTDVTGAVLTGRTIAWSSSDANIATVNSVGLVTAVAAGRADVTADVQGVKAVVAVTVTAVPSTPSAPAPVASVSVSLNAPTIVVGQSTQANAVLKDGTSAVLTGRVVTWTSSDPLVATVTATGYVSAVKAGSSTISASAEGKSGFAVVTTTAPVTVPAAIASVTVSLATPSVLIGQTTQATVTLKDSNGVVLTGRAVAWVSSDASVGSVDQNGVVKSLKAGSVTITASADGKTGSAMFTGAAVKPAVHMISLSTNASTIKIGELTQLSGVVKDANGVVITGVPIIWSSSPTTVATITTLGMATGRGVGTATIYAKADTVTRSIAISVIDSATVTTPVPVPDPVPVGPITSGNATMAELPRLSVSTSYPSVARQVRIAAGADFQAALNAAQPGDELLLAPGARYVGNFELPNKGANAAWIVIRTDVSDAALGAPGTR
ncbi:MAG: Ig domain protein group 2 domain protein, partial [Frankiales bacterium]|nr:Ig domain protein group 2 domain protein [Frankiales bacterium]